MQNHPAALTAALERGWDVEVDVWRTHGQALKVGHDRPQYEWTLPSPQIGPGSLFLHLKAASADREKWSGDKEAQIRDVVEKAGWGERTVRFVSPASDDYPPHMWRIDVVTSRQGLHDLDQFWLGVSDMRQNDHPRRFGIGPFDAKGFAYGVPSHVSGFWCEQLDEDWVSTDDILDARIRYKVPIYVLSPELHGRQVHLDRLMQWKEADSIVTDMPHLYEQLFDTHNPIVHPQGVWW
jgi:hypothetical protein